jgi:hypothetical protein
LDGREKKLMQNFGEEVSWKVAILKIREEDGRILE